MHDDGHDDGQNGRHDAHWMSLAPGAYDGHDEPGEHMPLGRTYEARYARTKAWRDRFRADATHYATTRPPVGTDLEMWMLFQRAAEAQAAELDEQMREMREQGLVPADPADADVTADAAGVEETEGVE